MPDDMRVEERKDRLDYWVTKLEIESNRVLSAAFYVGFSGIVIGAVIDWLFDWKLFLYAAGLFTMACYLDSTIKSLEAQRRRFHLSVLTPLEDTVDRIERRLQDIEKSMNGLR